MSPQRYEGASTIFGPHTCSFYMRQFGLLTQALLRGAALPPGPSPPDLSDEVITLLPGVIFDMAPFGYSIGDVVAQPFPLALAGETVTAKFVSGHPRNTVTLNTTFLTVQRQRGGEGDAAGWDVVATDANWETR